MVSIADDDYPADVDVSFGQAAYTAAEGGTVTVKVTLSPAPERTVTVLIEDAVQDGATSADYSGVPTSLTFAAADTEKTFSFAATDDSVDDDGESVKLTFGTLPTGISEGTVKESVVSITDDDVPSVTVAFEQATYTAAEGSTVTVKVKLSADPERTVTVLIEDAVQGGATDDDYSGVPGSVTFSSGDTEKTFVFAAAADSVDDDGESVKLTFGTLPTGVAEGTVKESVVSITDDDTANITISTTSLDVGEGGSATYTVKLATEPTGDVTVTIAGIAGTDLSTDLTSLTYTSTTWNDTQTVTVSAAHDADAVDDVATVSNTATSADGDYDGIAKNVAINVEDDESEDPELSIALPDPVHNDIDDSGDVSLGDVLTYTATASNTGNVPLSDITVEDLLVNTTGVGCATLAIGATCVMTGSYTVTQSDVDDGTVDNTATADSAETTAQTATRSTGVAQTEAVSLAKSSSDSSFQVVGDEVEYEYLVSNSGTVTLTGTLQITDNKIPSGISCDDVPESGLAPAATLTCTATYTVVQSDLDVSGVTNTATASLGDATSNQSSVTVPWVGLQGTTPQLSIGAGSVSEDGSSIALLVALTPASLQTVTVSYASQDGTAKAGLDFTAPAAGSTVTFAPGSTSETITIPIIDDDIDEDNESFNVILSNAVNAAIGLSSGPVTINDDDTAGVSVSRTALAVTEGDSTGGTYTVVLDTRPTADVTVTVSGHSGTDLTLNPDPATLIFTPAAWDTAQTVTVTAGQDADGTNDTVSLTHGATSTDSGYAGIAIAGVAVTVSDDETPSTDVALSVVPEKVSEGADATTVTVTGTLNNAPRSSATSVTVVVGASDDDAAEGTDYGTVSDFTLTIGAGATSGTAAFTLTPTDDDVDEEDEALTVAGSVAGSAQGLTVTSAAVTIEDDDTAGVSVSRTALAVTEGDSTGGTYTVVLDTRPTADVVVTVAGHAGTDVTLNPTALTFTSITWDTAQTVTVTAGQDADGTNDTVSLTHGATSTDSGYAGIAIAGVAVTVSDDDTPSTDVALSVVPEKVSEGAAATTVTVTGTLNNAPRSSATSVTVVVGASDDDAAEGTDYGTVSDFTLTIGAGATSGTAAFTLNPTDDDVDEEDEALTVAGSVQGLTVTSAAVTIEDDDTAGVSVSRTALAVTEGDSTGGTYTVVLDSRPSADVTVTVSGHAGTDLTLNPDPASLTFTPMTWDMAQTVTVTAGHDVDGTNDTVSLTHGATSTDSNYQGITIAGVEVTITDDDMADEEDETAGVTVSKSSLAVTEGDSAGGTYTVVLDSQPTADVVVTVAGDTGTDVTLNPTALTFTSITWDTAQTVTVTAGQDADGTNDTVSLTHSATSTDSGYGGIAIASVEVTITDDDTAGVTVSKSAIDLVEGNSDTYTVKLDTEPTGDVVITVNAPTNPDVSTNQSSLTFTSSDWNMEQTVAVTVAHDADGADETATITHTVGSDNDSVYDNENAASVLITITDVPSVTASFEQATYTAAEGGSVTVKVKLSAAPERTVTVPITKANQDGATNDDWSGVPENVTFSSGDTEKTFDFAAFQDFDDDDGESVKLTFGTLPAGVTAGTNDEATVLITDDDETIRDEDLIVSFEQLAYTVTEGSFVPVKVTLSADPERTVTVPITVHHQNSVTSTDYSGVPASVSFAAGQTENTFNFSAFTDDLDENDERVDVRFGPLPEGVVARSGHQEATVTILDSLRVSFSEANYEAHEGGENAEVVVLLDAPALRLTEIPLTVTTINGVSAEDWDGVPASLTFNVGESQKSFEVIAVDDLVEDDGEMIELGFSDLPSGVVAGSPSSAIVEFMNMEVPTTIQGPLINRIEPTIVAIYIAPGESVRIDVDIYGLQDMLDNSLGALLEFAWDDGNPDPELLGTKRQIPYIAPIEFGRYRIIATTDPSNCAIKDPDACRAEFDLIVMDEPEDAPDTPTPVDPSDHMPEILTGDDGTPYEVFTPVNGGKFIGEEFELTAPPGAVPDGEFIGVSVEKAGSASNVGQTHHRFTLGGNWYRVQIVDFDGSSIEAYELSHAAEICIPLPANLRGKIHELSVVAMQQDGFTVLASRMMLRADGGTQMCGRLSQLPAEIAVALRGAPPPLPANVPVN